MDGVNLKVYRELVMGVGWEWGVKDVCYYVQYVSRIKRANVN